jgi:SAM-dependent methyltransferase
MDLTRVRGRFSLRSDTILARFPVRKSELDRFKFGKRAYLAIAGIEGREPPLCLDVACGAKPFPNAHVLCDLHLDRVPDRSMRELKTEGKPFVLCDCRFLPFKDKAFGFVTSYYLIEHVDDPFGMFRELKRVSEHGYIQCPSWFNEIMYGEKVHKWTVLKRDGKLYVRSLGDGKQFRVRLGFVFHRLYHTSDWQTLHAILDETLHLFTVRYEF